MADQTVGQWPSAAHRDPAPVGAQRVIRRTPHPTVPPRTEYRLTLAGRELHHPVNGLCR
ncbi:winged helix-turn-helix transcriptional regulator [Micromonospora radicis]|uniref:HTH hxlR-type domain-containing protein n=1 Tax=Micromonospora radicis TaxID=1894971 RepID=A0A418MWH9_9ACTN|nr:hypothetical protein D2L64_09670 [Micromonospora radicis]